MYLKFEIVANKTEPKIAPETYGQEMQIDAICTAIENFSLLSVLMPYVVVISRVLYCSMLNTFLTSASYYKKKGQTPSPRSRKK